MSWLKVTFNQQQIVENVYREFDSQIQTIYNVRGRPAGFGCYSAVENVGSENLSLLRYLSPVAARYCKEIVTAYHGSPCDKPNCSDIESVIGDDCESV